ncbi:MAG: GTPase [Thermovirgaceae bacterium]
MARTVWYPGHMAKGLRQLKDLLQKLDVIVEVRDARAPEATASPFSKQAEKVKPLWIVLSKRDLADEKVTRRWVRFYRDQGKTAWAFDLRSTQLKPLLSEVGKEKPSHRDLRLAVIGIPNVGKSMFLNLVIGKKAASVGAVPGVTKGVSWYRGRGFLVVDSPGIVDPKSDAAVHRLLAWLAGSRSDVIGGYESVALDFITYAQERRLWEKTLGSWDIAGPGLPPADVLVNVGKRLGCLVKGGRVDLERAGKMLLDSFATGKLGRVSLETPETAAFQDVKR